MSATKYVLIRQWKGRKKDPQYITKRWSVEELLKIVQQIDDGEHVFIIEDYNTGEEVWRSE